MTRYHITPETGNPGVCNPVKTGKCKYGDVEHYLTHADARSAFEKQMEEDIKLLSTSDILETMPLKEMDAALLATTLFTEAQARNLDANYIASAIDVAAILHAPQTRAVRAGFPRTPYIEHPLRNAVRLMRMGVKDKDLIVAAVLHDTVEDGAGVFVEKYLKITPSSETENREKLRSFIKHKYGEHTLDVVDAVTNPVVDESAPKPSRQEKNSNYRVHVVEQISKNPGAYLVKFSDFIDNAGSLYHQDQPGNESMVYNMAVKYSPLISDFKEHAHSVETLVSPNEYTKIHADLDKLEVRLKNIIEKHKPAKTKSS